MNRFEKLVQFPNNGLLADYITTNEMINVYKKNISFHFPNKNTIYLSYGFHLENASNYINRIDNLLKYLKTRQNTSFVTIKYCYEEYFGNTQ